MAQSAQNSIARIPASAKGGIKASDACKTISLADVIVSVISNEIKTRCKRANELEAKKERKIDDEKTIEMEKGISGFAISISRDYSGFFAL